MNKQAAIDADQQHDRNTKTRRDHQALAQRGKTEDRDPAKHRQSQVTQVVRGRERAVELAEQDGDTQPAPRPASRTPVTSSIRFGAAGKRGISGGSTICSFTLSAWVSAAWAMLADCRRPSSSS